MGYGTSLGTAHEDEISYVLEKGLTDKQLADQSEINQNSTSGDFRSRFDVPMPSTMPLEASRKLTDAFKSQGGTQIPEKSPETKLDTIPDVYPTPDYLNPPEKTMSFRPSAVGMIKGFWEALKIPGESSQGKIPMWAMDPETGEFNTSTQAIEKSTELAGLMIGGPAPVAARMADGSLGSFMGVRSKTIDKTKLYKAQEMEMNGVHPDDIWTDTGTFRGADNRWRQEINDKRSNLKEEHLNVSSETPDKGWESLGKKKTVSVPSRYGDLINDPSIESLLKSLAKPDSQKVLGHILHHPTLYDAYPWLQNVKVYPLPKESPYYGLARTGEGQMEIHMAELPVHEFHSTLMHEVQHLIQAHEGFAQGGNAGMFRPKGLDTAEANFNRIRAKTEEEIKEAGVVSENSIEDYKNLVKYKINNSDVNPKYLQTIEDLKKKYPSEAEKLENIAKAENLLSKAALEHQAKYRSIMGEVESRNVQARMDMDAMMRHLTSPRETEEIIMPRKDQIRSPSDGPSASEPIDFRKGANDNIKKIIREPEPISTDIIEEMVRNTEKQQKITNLFTARADLHKIRTERDWSDIDLAKYNRLGKEINKISGDPEGVQPLTNPLKKYEYAKDLNSLIKQFEEVLSKDPNKN